MRRWLGCMVVVALFAVGCQGEPAPAQTAGEPDTGGASSGLEGRPEPGSPEARVMVEEWANLSLPDETDVEVVRAEDAARHAVARFELDTETAKSLCDGLGGALVYRDLREEDADWSGLTQDDLGELAWRCSASDPDHVLRQRTLIIVPADDGRSTVHLRTFEMPD